MRRIATNALAIIVISSMPCLRLAAQPAEEVVVVRVIPVNDPRLPALGIDDTHQLLDIASTMIFRSYGRRVNFDLQPAETLPKWFDDRWATIAPYEIPTEYRADLFDEDLKRFEQYAFDACKLYGTVEQLKGLLDQENRTGVTNHATAARALLRQYQQHRDEVRDMTLRDGSKLMTPATRRMFSHGHWGVWFANAPDIKVPELFLTNIMLIDDFLADPAPHALATSLAYAFMYPTTNRVVVTTYPVFAPETNLLPPACRTLSAEQRQLLIPYCIAHEVGTHLLLEVDDSYAEDGGLARPIRALRDPSIVAKYAEWPPARVDLRKIDQKQQRIGVLSHRLDIAIARKERAAAERALEEALDLNQPDKQLNEMGQRYERARWD